MSYDIPSYLICTYNFSSMNIVDVWIQYISKLMYPKSVKNENNCEYKKFVSIHVYTQKFRLPHSEMLIR